MADALSIVTIEDARARLSALLTERRAAAMERSRERGARWDDIGWYYDSKSIAAGFWRDELIAARKAGAAPVDTKAMERALEMALYVGD